MSAKARGSDEPAEHALALHESLPEPRFSRRIDAAVRRLGDAVSWIWIALIGVVLANVVLRYAFGQGSIELEEAQWHLYAAGFLVALGYTLESDDHIRVDFLRSRLSPRLQAWVELYGILLLLLPFVVLVLASALPFVASSFEQGEVSAAPGGLPLRFAIKATLLGGFGLLGLAALARLLRVASFLFGAPRDVDPNAPVPRREDS
jgi:TRAP-type mannitol/chloroaromatic compound transport system permease small subunit